MAATMFGFGTEAVALSRAQSLSALYRIIPRELVKRVALGGQHQTSFCSRVPSVIMVYFVLAMGLFTTDCYRQIFRWLRPWRKGTIPGRSALCEARKRLGVAPLVRLADGLMRFLEPGIS